jgi:hypothetical protein
LAIENASGCINISELLNEIDLSDLTWLLEDNHGLLKIDQRDRTRRDKIKFNLLYKSEPIRVSWQPIGVIDKHMVGIDLFYRRADGRLERFVNRYSQGGRAEIKIEFRFRESKNPTRRIQCYESVKCIAVADTSKA